MKYSRIHITGQCKILFPGGSSMATIPITFYSALSFAPNKSWQIGMLQNSSTAELLQLLAPTIGVYPNQIALFLRAGNNDQQVPDGASPVVVFHQFSQANPQVFFVIKERGNQQQPQQPQGYQQHQVQYQQPQQQQYQQQEQQSPTGSPYGSTENSETLKQQLKTVTEELKKMETQKGLITQKTTQLQAEIQGIDKKLIQVQAFAGNFPAGTSENLQQQKFQFHQALQQISQTSLVLNDKLLKYQQYTEVLENRIFQAAQAEKEFSKAKALQQASTLTFQPNLEYEKQLVAPDYVVSQIDGLLRQNGVQGNFSLAEKLICLLQSSCPLEKSIRVLLLLTTDPNNRARLPETRILPVILNLLKTDLDTSLRKNLFTLVSNLPSNDASKHALAKAGVIPVAVAHLDNDDAQIVDLALLVLASVLIDDVYCTIFQHQGGVTKIIAFFNQGTPQQQMRALHVLSQAGFSEEEDAVTFVNGSGNISAICDLIDSAEKEELREMAVRIVISLTKIAPVPMIESGSVGRVIELIDSKSTNTSLLKMSLQSIIPLLINNYVKQTISDRILGDLVFLLDSPDDDIVAPTLAILAGVFDSNLNREDIEEHQNNCVQKVVPIFCNPSTKQAEIESSLKILASTGFPSSQSQLEFTTQGGIEISLTFLMADDKIPALNAFTVLSHVTEHHSAIINSTKRSKLILSHLKSQLEDIDFIHGFLASLNQFCTSEDNSVAEYFVKAGAFELLIHLLNHFDEKIVLLAAAIIKALCIIPTNQTSFVNSTGIPTMIKLLLSTKEETRNIVLDFISTLASISNEFRVAFGKYNIVKPISEVFAKEKATTMVAVVHCIASDFDIQCQAFHCKLLDQLIRHLRSKDLQLALQLVEVLSLLSTNNLLVAEALVAKDALIHLVRLVETLMLRVKLQITDRLLMMINQILQLIINLSVCSTARIYLIEKTIMKITLKKLKTLNDSALKQSSVVLLGLLAFPVNTTGSIGTSFRSDVVQMIDTIQICSIPNEWSSDKGCITPATREEIVGLVSVEIANLEKQQGQTIKILTPEQQEQKELAKKIGAAEENLSLAEERCERNRIETVKIKESIDTISNEIRSLEEMNDDVLLPEIENKKKELVDLRKLLEDSDAISELALQSLEEAKLASVASMEDKKRLEELTNSLANLSLDNEENDQKRLHLVVEMYLFVKQFIEHMQKLQQGYLGSVSDLLTYNRIKCSSDDSFVLQQFSIDIQEVSRVCSLLLDKITKNLQSLEEFEIGKDLQTFSEFLQPFLLFSKHYEPFVKTTTALVNKQELNELLQPIQCSLNLQYFSVYPMLVIRFGYYLSFFTNSLMKVTEVTRADYRSLASAQRKFQSFLSNIEKKEQMVIKTVPLKEQRYQKLVSLLNESEFLFLDVFGELKESEKIVHQCVRLFATQGMISSFLEHQISKEVAETVGESTLFRGKTFPTQCLSAFSHIIDSEYLLGSLGVYLRRLHGSGKSLEVNPRLIGSDVSENDPQVKQHQELLRKECELAFSFINGTANQCTTSLRNVCYSLRKSVQKRFPGNDIISVGGLFFLRFICPCFVTPERFNICKSEEIDKQTRRNCILVSKVLQNLSNNVRFALKEPFMVPLNEFLDENSEKMKNLLIRLSDRLYPEEPLSLLKDNDLFDIHENLVKNQAAIDKALQDSGSLSLRERFIAVMKDLGAPIAPQTTSTNDTPAQVSRKRPLSVRLLRRRSTQIIAAPVVNHAAVKFYLALANQLKQPNYQLAQAIWTAADNKKAEILCKSFVRLFEEYGVGSDCTKLLIQQEVTNCMDPATLFRSNSFAPKFVSEFSQFVGHDYLVSIIRPLIQKMQNSNISLEVDANRLNKDEALAAKGQVALSETCRDWFDFIASKEEECPIQLKLACKHLKVYVSEKFPSNALISVGGLFFLRFICPAIINPERLKLLDNPLTSGQRRNLILICKVLQNLSNDILFGKKEPFMIPLNEFIASYRPAMISLLDNLADVSDDHVLIVTGSCKGKKVTEEYKESLEVAHEVLTVKSTVIREDLKQTSDSATDFAVDGFEALLIQMEAAFPPTPVIAE